MKEDPSTAVWEDRRFVAIVITVAAVFLCFGWPVVYIYQTYPELRASIVLIKDLFIGFFTLSGILIALENLRRSGLSSRKLLALRFVDDWGTEFSKSGWRILAKQIAECDQAQIGEIWNSDSSRQGEIRSLLNSCERIAQAVNEGSADERTIRERIGPTVSAYFSTVRPLVAYLRYEKRNQYLLIETERLVSRWEGRGSF